MSEPAAGRPSGGLLAVPAAVLWGALLAASGLFLAAYLAVAGLRFAYPYHLEWMEGGVLHHVRWILDGHPLYGRPGLLFTPYTYPPLYFYVAAGAARLLGAGLPALRLVSILSSLGCFALLYRMAERESGSRSAGLLAAGLFAATFRAAGSWLDLARVDSLFLLLLLGGVHLLRSGTTSGAAVVAGALLALAALTKQTALVVAVPLLLGALALSPRRAVVAAAAFAGLFGASTLALDLFHGGWYRFYVFDLPAELPFLGLPLSRFLRRDLLVPLAVALPLALFWLVRQAMRREGRRAALFHGAAALGMLAAAYAGRNKVGGFLNALLPAYAYVALLAALAVVGLRRELAAFASRGETSRGETARRAALGRLAEAAVCLLAILQLGLLAYDPRGQLPSASDRRAGDELVAKLRAAQGEVLLPEFGYLAGLAGKTVYAHSVATWDVMAGRDRKPGAALLAEMKRAMREDRFAAILFAQEGWDGPDWFGPDLRGYTPVRLAYRPLPEEAGRGTVLSRGARWAQRRDVPRPRDLAGADVFLPLTGYQLRPTVLYRPRPQ